MDEESKARILELLSKPETLPQALEIIYTFYGLHPRHDRVERAVDLLEKCGTIFKYRPDFAELRYRYALLFGAKVYLADFSDSYNPKSQRFLSQDIYATAAHSFVVDENSEFYPTLDSRYDRERGTTIYHLESIAKWHHSIGSICRRHQPDEETYLWLRFCTMQAKRIHDHIQKANELRPQDIGAKA